MRACNCVFNFRQQDQAGVQAEGGNPGVYRQINILRVLSTANAEPSAENMLTLISSRTMQLSTLRRTLGILRRL